MSDALVFFFFLAFPPLHQKPHEQCTATIHRRHVDPQFPPQNVGMKDATLCLLCAENQTVSHCLCKWEVSIPCWMNYGVCPMFHSEILLSHHPYFPRSRLVMTYNIIKFGSVVGHEQLGRNCRFCISLHLALGISALPQFACSTKKAGF